MMCISKLTNAEAISFTQRESLALGRPRFLPHLSSNRETLQALADVLLLQARGKWTSVCAHFLWLLLMPLTSG